MACSILGLPLSLSFVSNLLNTSGEHERSYMLEISVKEGDLAEYVRSGISEALKDLSLVDLGRDFVDA